MYEVWIFWKIDGFFEKKTWFFAKSVIFLSVSYGDQLDFFCFLWWKISGIFGLTREKHFSIISISLKMHERPTYRQDEINSANFNALDRFFYQLINPLNHLIQLD